MSVTWRGPNRANGLSKRERNLKRDMPWKNNASLNHCGNPWKRRQRKPGVRASDIVKQAEQTAGRLAMLKNDTLSRIVEKHIRRILPGMIP